MPIKTEYIATFQQAIQNGTFLTSRHHPSGVGVALSGYRTVTVQDPSGLYDYLGSGDFSIRHYHNNDYPKSPEYVVITPNDPTYVAGSGIPAYSGAPIHDCDRLVVVSGVNQSWHVHAEQQTCIDAKSRNGRLVYLGEVH